MIARHPHKVEDQFNSGDRNQFMQVPDDQKIIEAIKSNNGSIDPKRLAKKLGRLVVTEEIEKHFLRRLWTLAAEGKIKFSFDNSKISIGDGYGYD